MFVLLFTWDSGLRKVNILVRRMMLSANRISIGKPEWKRLLGKPRCSLDDILRWILKR